jgi:hypothetical protein
MKFVLLMALLFLTSCGESPLFNHKTEASFSHSAYFAVADANRFSKTDYSFTINWDKAPAMGENKFILRTWNKNSGTINGPYQDLPADFFSYLWMPAMGHGSVPFKFKKIATGEYEVSNVYFIMGGDWQLHLQLKNGSQVIDEVVVIYSL